MEKYGGAGAEQKVTKCQVAQGSGEQAEMAHNPLKANSY